MKARRQGDENPNFSVVIETMKLLADSSYGYQLMDLSPRTMTKYMNDEKTHSALNSKMFKRLNHITDQLFEVEMVEPEIEHREPMIVDFLFYIMLNRECWKFTIFSSKTFVTLTSMKSFKLTQTASIWLCRKETWKMKLSLKSETSGIQSALGDCTDPSTANAFFPQCIATHTRNTITGNQVSFGKNLVVQKGCVYAVKRIVAMIERVTSTSLAAKV